MIDVLHYSAETGPNKLGSNMSTAIFFLGEHRNYEEIVHLAIKTHKEMDAVPDEGQMYLDTMNSSSVMVGH